MSFSTYKIATVIGLTALSVGVSFIGCSSDDTSNPPPTQDGGKDTGTPSGPQQKGTIVSLISPATVAPGLTVDLGGKTGVTDSKGAYAIAPTLNTPFFMKVSGPNYTTLIEQEWSISGDVERGKTPVPDIGTAKLLAAGLPGLDAAKGVLGVGVAISKTGTCTSEEGAKIRIDTGTVADAGADGGDAGADPSAPRVVYFDGPTARGDQSLGVKKDQTQPSAIIYNVPPSDNVKVVVTLTGCTQLKDSDFPIADPTAPNLKYTGKIKVVAAGDVAKGGTISFGRVFLK
ncbi:hypothetical protein [Pendulispora albinea]|uniref:Carboxypeptidase regulatory-like domain-containing protein n=1 Tax=Pendulispora albinea TaxID=2741071 RepID=A0ABZ2M4M9_9BACT